MLSNESQCAKILAMLKDGENITPGTARMRYGCDRLAARIYALRKRLGDKQNPDGSWNFIDRQMIKVGPLQRELPKGQRAKQIALYYWVPRIPT
jgi:hypothetical protein